MSFCVIYYYDCNRNDGLYCTKCLQLCLICILCYEKLIKKNLLFIIIKIFIKKIMIIMN